MIVVSLNDEEESDEARGGPTERGKKRKPPRNAVVRRRKGEGKQGEEEGQEDGGKKKEEANAERVTAVELRAGPFIARTKKTNRRDERSRARYFENGHRVAVKSR